MGLQVKNESWVEVHGLFNWLPLGHIPPFIVRHSYENVLITRKFLVIPLEIWCIEILSILNLTSHVSVIRIICLFEVRPLLRHWHRRQQSWFLRIDRVGYRSGPRLKCLVWYIVLAEIESVSSAIVVLWGHLCFSLTFLVDHRSHVVVPCGLAILPWQLVPTLWSLSAWVAIHIQSEPHSIRISL